jgi:peptidoglycan/LPS O-acetylase OafA/YrhL
MDAAAAPRLGYRPALDGLRGVAVALVVMEHLTAFLWPASWGWLFPGGFLGVDLFFVLSGFLITTLILERREEGERGLGRFYGRRALRLLPAVLFMLAAVDIVAVALDRRNGHAAIVSTVATLLYVGNWAQLHGNVWLHYFGHVWSLAVEEQFYIVWPAFLLALLAAGLSRRAVLRIVGAGIALVVVWRAHLWGLHPYWGAVYARTDARADSLFAGAAVALLRPTRWLPNQPRKRIERAGTTALALFLLAALTVHREWAGLFLGGFTVLGVAAAVAIVAAVDGRWRCGRLLATRPLVALGRVSYGVYLWHFPVFTLLADHGPHNALIRCVMGLGITGIMTTLSYRLIEQPALRLKARLSRPASPVRGRAALRQPAEPSWAGSSPAGSDA